MAVYREEKTNTWRVIYRYTDWTGERKQSQKRGFKTKREAQAWEREQLNKISADLDMTFKRVFYANLLSSCKLNSYLADVDEQAEDMFSRLVKQLAEKENVTENLKAENQMLWVQKMNSIRNRATEVVNANLIYA